MSWSCACLPKGEDSVGELIECSQTSPRTTYVPQRKTSEARLARKFGEKFEYLAPGAEPPPRIARQPSLHAAGGGGGSFISASSVSLRSAGTAEGGSMAAAAQPRAKTPAAAVVLVEEDEEEEEDVRRVDDVNRDAGL